MAYRTPACIITHYYKENALLDTFEYFKEFVLEKKIL